MRHDEGKSDEQLEDLKNTDRHGRDRSELQTEPQEIKCQIKIHINL